MRLASRVAAVLPLVALAFATASSLEPVSRARAIPRPTEHYLDEGAESRNKKARREWMAYIHKAAPDADWRAIERENGLREMARRNALQQRESGGPAAGAPAPWREVGSDNQAGRMHCASFSTAGDAIYAGSSLGGVWRGNLDGSDWTPLADNLYGGAHEIVVAPSDSPGGPDVIVAITDSGSLHVSRDDGETWIVPPGAAALRSVRGVATLQDAAGTILVFGRVSGVGSPAAILASTDRALTFSTRWVGAGHDGWMWAPRAGDDTDDTVYLLHQGRLKRSSDGGFTFPFETVVDAAATRGVLAGSEAGAPTLYAAVQVSGSWRLHRSTNGGSTFTIVTSITDFWETLCASSVNPDLVMYAGVEARRSTNGGSSFTKINNWGDYYGSPSNRLHADVPGIHCYPDATLPSQERWFISTDGGLYESRDGGLTVANLSLQGLGVSQYYSTLTSRTNPDLILAGSQDQGYQRGVYEPSTGPGPSTPFAQLLSGDYGHLTSSDGSFGLVYSTYPGFVLVSEGDAGSILYPFVDFPAGSQHAWLPPVVADPLDPESFFFCADRLHRYTRVSGPTWSRAQHSTQDFTLGGGSYMSALAFAPSDPQRAYAVNDSGRLFASSDHGVTWTSATGAPSGQYFYGNAIDVHPTDPLEAVVGGSGYSGPGVMRTVDGGATWTPLVTGLPATLVYSLAYAEDGSGDVYAGTETGAYRFHRASGAWVNIMEPGTPITIYWSAESVNDGRTIRFGTYGRGIWDFDVPIEPDLACRYGTVATGAGATPRIVLFLNGSSGDPIRREHSLGLRQPITLTLDRSPSGPSFPDYAVWVWPSDVANPRDVFFGGDLVGCTVNPPPIEAGLAPRAIRCVRGGFGAEWCGSAIQVPGAPATAPWTLARARGFGRPITLTVQGIIEDSGSAAASGVSVTNAIVLRIQ